MVKIPVLTDKTRVFVSPKLEGGMSSADCVVTKFAKGTVACVIQDSSIDKYIVTRGAHHYSLLLGGNCDWSSGSPLSDSETMVIMATWYLDNVYPLLHEVLDSFTNSEDDKINGFEFWMFYRKDTFIQLTGWWLTRYKDEWEYRVFHAKKQIAAGATFKSAIGC